MISYDGKEYQEEDLTEKEILLVKHIQAASLAASEAQFQMEAQTVLKEAMESMLQKELKSRHEATDKD